MKHKTLAILLACLLVGTALFADPKMVIQESTFNAGTVYRTGEQLKHDFVIQNTGDADLDIISATPGCGCTVTDFDKVIRPGAQGKVSASINLAHFKGPIEKFITVATNDPKQSQVKLSVKADVKTYVDIAPAETVTLRGNKGETPSQELTLTPTYEKPVHLTNATVDSEAFDVSLAPSGPDDDKDKKYTLKVGLKGPGKVGQQSGMIKIASEGSPEKELSIPVVAIIRGSISFTPQTVSFILKSFPDELAVTKVANLRQQPDATSAKVAALSPGMKLRVIAQKPDWYQVITQPPDGNAQNPLANKIGWVSRPLVKVTRASQDPDPQVVTINKVGNEGFKVLDSTSSLAPVKVQVAPASDGKSYSLTLSLDKASRPEKTTPGAVTVKTDDADQPEIRIPVFIIVS